MYPPAYQFFWVNKSTLEKHINALGVQQNEQDEQTPALSLNNHLRAPIPIKIWDPGILVCLEDKVKAKLKGKEILQLAISGASERKSSASDRKTPFDLKTTMGITKLSGCKWKYKSSYVNNLNSKESAVKNRRTREVPSDDVRAAKEDGTRQTETTSHSDEPAQLSSIE
ncbi:hypothetical protein OROMI_023627 [Orobanche minor]